MAMGRNSSSMSRMLKTTIRLLNETLVGRFKNPAKVPSVYFLMRMAIDSAPASPSKIFWKSDNKGTSFGPPEKLLSVVMSLRA